MPGSGRTVLRQAPLPQLHEGFVEPNETFYFVEVMVFTGMCTICCRF